MTVGFEFVHSKKVKIKIKIEEKPLIQLLQSGSQKSIETSRDNKANNKLNTGSDKQKRLII
jgi:hypothetical protein